MTDDDVKLPHPDFRAFKGPNYYDEATVLRLIAEAKAEEREACAVLCENRMSYWQRDDIRRYEDEMCATAIRNRSNA